MARDGAVAARQAHNLKVVRSNRTPATNLRKLQEMKYYVYCLISEKNKNFHYYGFTSNIDQRIKYHKAGKVRTTNRFLPIRLLGYREFESREEALKYEKELKTKASYRKKFVEELEKEQAHLPA